MKFQISQLRRKRAKMILNKLHKLHCRKKLNLNLDHKDKHKVNKNLPEISEEIIIQPEMMQLQLVIKPKPVLKLKLLQQLKQMHKENLHATRRLKYVHMQWHMPKLSRSLINTDLLLIITKIRLDNNLNSLHRLKPVVLHKLYNMLNRSAFAMSML